MLLWLNDDSFEPQPLAKLNNLINFLQSANENIILPYIVIGPAGSRKLDIMIKELKNSKPWFTSLSMYSPIATLPNYQFLTNSDNKVNLEELEKKSRKEIQKLFKEQANIDFHRTISTDLELAYRLVEELKRRKVKSSEDHIVLISEWDTKYGRNLPEIFHDIIKEKTQTEVNWVHILSYLRGIDGIVPGLKDSPEQHVKDSAKKKTENNSHDQAEKLMMEEPVGRSQLDYLRRLADNLYQKDEQLQLEDKGRIRAVGILGTDFYDKYLVLQAFKQRFPAAIFFTTDLDARLLHEAYNDSTRNLIVASGFDLQLPKDIASITAPYGIAPFRSSYQTAIFCAIFQAFMCNKEIPAEMRPANCDKLEQKNLQNYEPYLFEIGYQYAINLDADRTTFLPDNKQVLIKKQMLIIAFIALTISLFWIISLGFRKWVAHHLIFSLMLLLTLLYIGYLFYSHILSYPSEEPFSLTKGISIWPTEIIRLMALIFTCIFFLNAKESIRQSDDQLGAEFSLDVPPPRFGIVLSAKVTKFPPPPFSLKTVRFQLTLFGEGTWNITIVFFSSRVWHL